MESRILKIWDVDEHGKPASKYREIYCGDYFERYKVTTKAMKLMCPEWKEFRIGFIRDDGTGRVAVFRQLVKNRNDPRPTDILMGRGGPKSGEDVLEAGSTDPQFAVPAGPQVSCYVCDFSERDPTEEEKEIIAASRRGPPPNAAPATSASIEASGTETKSDAHCKVCGWIHVGGDMTSFRDGERIYTFKSTTIGFKLLAHIHSGMEKGMKDVDCASFPKPENPYLGDLRDALKSKNQPDKHRVLLACVGNRRARIRKPEETPKKTRPAKKPHYRRKTG